ncbi:ADP-ribosylglycohydrolase family protein [Methanocaldococcus indicus]|uniref:ADP-ribosylglycohydrolase family protein n=1 Tax=Methanocaldococcus indicus TaxID=213231 RepID=UPI003C6CF548
MNKIYYSVFGAVVGDALGMPTENLRKEEIKELYGYVDDYVEPKNYLKGKLKKGQWTDDTEQAIALMKSLEKEGVNIGKFAKYLIEWAEKNPPDIGLTTLKAIEKLKNNDFSGVDGESCGAAMRIYPIPLYYKDLKIIKREIIKSSKITHNNPKAIAGALAIGFFVYKALNDEKNLKLLDECYTYIKDIDKEIAKRILEIKNFEDVDDAYNYFGTGVLAKEVVPSAIATYLLTDNFKEGMLKCINAGGDTDSLASMYGAIAGAYYEDIPKRWITNLYNREYIESLIKEVFGDCCV